MNKKRILEYLAITLGVFFVVAGSHFFFSPYNLVSGGVIGIAILLKDVLSESLFLLIANGLLLIIGGIVLGKEFFIKTAYATLAMPLIKFVLETIISTEQVVELLNLGSYGLIISSVFGGIFVGVGIGIVLRNNATTGGIDVIQQIASKYLKIPFALALFVIDGIIILLGFYINGFLLGLFGILTLIITALVLEYVQISGKTGYTIFIVTKKYEEIKESIFTSIDRGITKVNVVGGYTNEEKSMIICTISSRQLYDFKKIIEQNDPQAFTFVTKTHKALGEGFNTTKETFL